MATITEDYVSFETAKLLKEKGFDEPCYQCYVLFDKFVQTSYYETAVNSKLIKFERLYADEQPLINSKGFRNFINNKDKSRVFSAPTHQMAMKWLRKVYNIDISIIPLRSHKEYLPRIESDTISHNAIPCKEYEKAAEIAIKYCLENLI